MRPAKSGETLLVDVFARQMGAKVEKEKGERDVVEKDKVERAVNVWGGEPRDHTSSYDMVKEVGNMQDIEDAMEIDGQIEEKILSGMFPVSAERSTLPRLED